MPAWALKDCLNVIAEPLTFLINAFLAAEKIPSHLKRAHNIPIYKKGNTEDPSNYRPKSITSASSKIFEKVIKDQIDDYLGKTIFSAQYSLDFVVDFLQQMPSSIQLTK